MSIKTLPPVLSQIKILTPPKVNPNSTIAEEILENQCRDLGIWLPQLKDYTTMSGHLFPTTSMQRLLTLGLYFNFLFYIDDQYDRHNKDEINIKQEIYMRKIFDNCANILLNGEMPNSSHILFDTCAELRVQFLSLTSDFWLQRFVKSNMSHLKASTYTIEDIIDNSTDIVEDYINLRILDAGMYPMIDTVEFAQDIILPDEVIESESLRELRVYVARLGSLLNDIFSYTKEIIETNSRFSLICVLEDYCGYTFEDAVRKTVDIVNDDVLAFNTKADSIPSFGDKAVDKDVKKYIDGLRDQINACWHWQMATNRYRSEKSPFPELKSQII